VYAAAMADDELVWRRIGPQA